MNFLFQQLGIVIPSYNETETIITLVQEIFLKVPGTKIFIIDDSPHTIDIENLKKLNNPNLFLTHRQKKGGRGSAVILGIKLAIEEGCNWILEMDADYSHLPDEIPSLLKEIYEKKLDLLIGSRYLPSSIIINRPFNRTIFSIMANFLAKTLIRIPINDYTNGFRLYSKRAAEHVVKTCGIYGKGFIALSEILVQIKSQNYSISELPIVYKNRIGGKSTLDFNEIINAFLGIFRIYLLRRKICKKTVI